MGGTGAPAKENRMAEGDWMREQAALSLSRLWPRLELQFEVERARSPELWRLFERRLRHEWDRLFELMLRLYGGHYDFFYHLEQTLAAVARAALARDESLQLLDQQREADPFWFQSETMMGAVAYVDLFSGTLAGLHERIPYLKELGLTYLHLMPLFESPEGNSDGGYAVSSYRKVDPALGTMEELTDLATALRAEGISLVVDFVFNHTSDEHEWARRAQAGEVQFQRYYYIFPNREMPDAYERTLREIFPTIRRGNFTFHEGLQQWVWTSFNSFQWDLNYSNPELFRAMADEMLFLANAGIEILRLDAVAFIWKRLGTSSENQPEAHLIIQAFNALARIACPALLFKSEAIVHPDDVLSYIGPHECQLSYNPLLMALLWEALATREVRLLAHSMRHRFALPAGCAWINYLRSHDDIGWTFADDDAASLGINAYDHRRFLNMFYTGRFEGSFACGVPFQENPQTGDARVSGTLASLAGLEQALHAGDEVLLEMALRRVVLLHSIILSIGGIPLLYMGDELATLNDYRYVSDPAKAVDSRWVHRPATDWERVEDRHDPDTIPGRIFTALTHLVALRKEQRALWNGGMEVIDTGNPHLFGYLRHDDEHRLLVVTNFSEQSHSMDANTLRFYGMGYHFIDVVHGASYSAEEPLTLKPYGFVWLKPHSVEKGIDR
jgi:amylosucrase